MFGPIEVDETSISGKAKNQHASQRDTKRRVDGKYPIVGVPDRANGEVSTESFDNMRMDGLHDYLEENVRSDATVYSDEARSNDDLTQPLKAVQQSTGEYVLGDVQHSWHIRSTLDYSGRC